MRGSSFGYLLKEGFKSIYKNRVMSFAAIGVLVACMLLIASSMLFSINVTGILGYVEQQNEVVAFLEMDLSTESKEKIDKEVKKVDNISKFDFVSGKDGVLEWMDSLGDDSVYLEGLEDEDILPDSYRLKIIDIAKLHETVSSLEKIKGIEKIVAPIDVATTLMNIRSAIYCAGVFIVTILLAVSIVIIGNTIKITVFNQRKEINIMKMVGATDMFIRFPFFIEGCLLGIISATISFFLVWGGYELAINWITVNNAMSFHSFANNLVEFKTVALPMYLSLLAGGTLVGVGGSMIFVRKYLRV